LDRFIISCRHLKVINILVAVPRIKQKQNSADRNLYFLSLQVYVVWCRNRAEAETVGSRDSEVLRPSRDRNIYENVSSRDIKKSVLRLPRAQTAV